MTKIEKKAIETIRACVFQNKPFVILGDGLHIMNGLSHEVTTLLADAMADDDFRFYSELAFNVTGPNKNLSGIKQLKE